MFTWNAHAGFSIAFPTFFMHKAKFVSRDRGRHQGLELVWCQLGRWPWHEEFRKTHRDLRPPLDLVVDLFIFGYQSLGGICRGYFTSEDGIIEYQHEILGALLIIFCLGKHVVWDKWWVDPANANILAIYNPSIITCSNLECSSWPQTVRNKKSLAMGYTVYTCIYPKKCDIE